MNKATLKRNIAASRSLAVSADRLCVATRSSLSEGQLLHRNRIGRRNRLIDPSTRAERVTAERHCGARARKRTNFAHGLQESDRALQHVQQIADFLLA